MRAIRRDAQPRRKRERTRVASVLLAPGIAEARGQASVTYVGGAGDDPYLDSYREQLAEERERGDGRHRTPGVDEHGRTRSDRAAWASVLRGFVLALALATAGEARAACSGHQASITAGPDGTFRLCPREQAADGTPVGPTYYERCDVSVVWEGGGAAATAIARPLPGVPVLVSFPAAHGAGGATATCTSADRQTSPIAASAIRWRDLLPLPASPSMEGAP